MSGIKDNIVAGILLFIIYAVIIFVYLAVIFGFLWIVWNLIVMPSLPYIASVFGW